MDVVLRISDDVAEKLGTGADLEQRALEALALESYRTGRLTKAEIRRLLGIGSRYELDGFLKNQGVCEPYTLEDVEREQAAFRRLGLSATSIRDHIRALARESGL